MPKFRFVGTSISGRSIQGVITADSSSDAKVKIKRIASQHRIQVKQVQKSKVFQYKIQKGADEPVRGEQKAFSKDEVRGALERMGYKILSLQPKLFNFKMAPPATDVITFVRVSADMLREKLAFNEMLQLLINDTPNPVLRDALKEINSDLRQGKDSEEAFMRQEKVLGRFTARMLGLASKSGNMSAIYDSTAKFLERQSEFKRNLKSALIMPMFTILILFGACYYYIGFIFPDTAKLFVKLGTELPPMSAYTLKVSDFINEHSLLIVLGTLAVIGALGIFFTRPTGRFLIDKYIIRLPVLGDLVHKTYIEIFCRVFNSLYSGSGENIDAIKLAAEACGNRYIEQRIKTIAVPMMLNKGTGLVTAFEATGIFTKTALTRFSSGAETGTVKASALQIANFYEKETVYKLKNAVEFIQILIALVIMVVITGLTLLSAETAFIKPKSAF